MRAGVYIDVGDKTANKAAFDVLFEKKAELQAAARNNLIWNRLDNRKSSRIFIERHDSGLDQIASNPDEARRWLIERLLALKAAFGPAIPAAALVAEASRETSGSQIPELEGA